MHKKHYLPAQKKRAGNNWMLAMLCQTHVNMAIHQIRYCRRSSPQPRCQLGCRQLPAGSLLWAGPFAAILAGCREGGGCSAVTQRRACVRGRSPRCAAAPLPARRRQPRQALDWRGLCRWQGSLPRRHLQRGGTLVGMWHYRHVQ